MGAPMATCRRGHPWTPETTDLYPMANGGTGRRCAVCRRAAARWRYHDGRGRAVPPAPLPRTHAPVSDAIVTLLRAHGGLSRTRLRALLGYRHAPDTTTRLIARLRRRGLPIVSVRGRYVWTEAMR